MKTFITYALFYATVIIAVAAGYVLGEYAGKRLDTYLNRRFEKQVAF